MSTVNVPVFEFISEHIITTNDVVAVELRVRIDNQATTVTGAARRTPGDKRDKTIGTLLATARAYKALGRKLEKRANGLVSHQDKMKKQQAQQRAEREMHPSNQVNVQLSTDNVHRAPEVLYEVVNGRQRVTSTTQ